MGAELVEPAPSGLLNITWSFTRVPQECEPYVQCAIPTWTSPIKNPATGRWITSHVIHQDIVAWVGQGTMADRSRETLGASDRSITMLRRRFFVELTPSSPDEFEKIIRTETSKWAEDTKTSRSRLA